MTDHVDRPLLFLDVDGTVLPVGGAQRPSTIEEWYAIWQTASNPQLATIVPGHGPRLRAMPCDLMWATAWMADANKVIAPLIGLPELPVVDLGEVPGFDDPVWSEHDPAAEFELEDPEPCRAGCRTAVHLGRRRNSRSRSGMGLCAPPRTGSASPR